MDYHDFTRLRKRLFIDAMNIDDELIEYPQILMEVSTHVADLIRTRDQTRHDAKVARAKAADEIRREPLGEGEKARSETQINSLLDQHPGVIRAERQQIVVAHECQLWQGLLDSMQEKGKAMRTMGQLMASGYLAPSAVYEQRKDDLSRERERRAESSPSPRLRERQRS